MIVIVLWVCSIWETNLLFSNYNVICLAHVIRLVGLKTAFLLFIHDRYGFN
jgi:hypothetical protein